MHIVYKTRLTLLKAGNVTRLLLKSYFLGLILFSNLAFAEDSLFDSIERVQEKIETLKLDNGLTFILYKRGEAPVFGGVVSVKVGGIDEPEGKTGIAHLLEHMAFKGTTTLGTKDYATERLLLEKEEALEQKNLKERLTKAEEQELETIRSQLLSVWDTEAFDREFKIRGATGMNASTDADLTKYYVQLPRTGLNYWCWIESERILNPVLRQFYTERNVVLEERRMRFDDDPSGAAYEQLLLNSYTAHAYRNPVIGYKSDIQKITATDLEQFRKKYYVPSNIVIGLVGDVDLKRDEKIIRHYFERIPKGEDPVRNISQEPPQVLQKIVTIQKEASPQLYISYHKPIFPDKKDVYLTVLQEILAGSTLTPLYKELVGKQRVAVSVSVEEAPGYRAPNLLVFMLVPSAISDNDRLLNSYDKVIDDFLKQKPSEEVVRIAKRKIANQYLDLFNDSLGFARLLSSSQLLYGDWRELFSWYDELLKVTADDVMNAAQDVLKTSNRTVVKLENKR